MDRAVRPLESGGAISISKDTVDVTPSGAEINSALILLIHGRHMRMGTKQKNLKIKIEVSI